MSYRESLLATCLGCCLAVFPGAATSADGPRLLSEVELDQITAGSGAGTDVSEDLAALEFNRTTRAGSVIHADGEVSLVDASERLPAGVLQITGNAQSGLSSLINVNAVNSEVTILLNLNISVDSNIGTLNQMNFNSRLTSPPPRSP